MSDTLTNQLVGILEKSGPLTGKELLRETGYDDFLLWSACTRSPRILTRIIGRRYLRLDQQVDDYARLSPSIMREFYGYTVIGTAGSAREIGERGTRLEEEMAAISNKKFQLARKVAARLADSHPDHHIIGEQAAFMLAGDVVYGMAHGEPRPESSTGELVQGSDLDIIVVGHNLPDPIRKSLDEGMYREKYELLMNPASREEIDYIIKDLSRVREQLRFEDFPSMVACKILHESQFLHGSRAIFQKIKEMLREEGITDRLRSLEEKAVKDRSRVESFLLKVGDGASKQEAMKLFRTAEEQEEIF